MGRRNKEKYRQLRSILRKSLQSGELSVHKWLKSLKLVSGSDALSQSDYMTISRLQHECCLIEIRCKQMEDI